MNKKKSIIIILLIVLFGGLLFGFLYRELNKMEDNGKKDNNPKPINEAIVSKIEENKDWVYDAEYTKNVTATSYSTYYDTYYSKDIVVPFINVDSSYANLANNEIKKVHDMAIDAYNMGVNDKTTYVDVCKYKQYIKSNKLSVVLTFGVGATDVVIPDYYTYNIDLNTGNQLSYEEVYTIAGFTSGNINTKVEKAITKVMEKEMSDFSPKYQPGNSDFEKYNNISINNYKNSIDTNTLKYFLNENSNLNIIVTLAMPAGTGEFDTIITVE